MFHRDNEEMNKLADVIKKYAELGAVAEFEKDGDFFVVTVTVLDEVWRAECATMEEAVITLNKHLEEDL
jgi:hypothetical protein